MNSKNGHIREFETFRIDLGKKILWSADDPVSLPAKAVELLCLLIENQGNIVTKDELLNTVWRDSFVEESVLTQNIYLLRKVFKDANLRDNLIQTVPRRGYRFNGEVHEIDLKEEFLVEHEIVERSLIAEVSEDSFREFAPPVIDISQRKELSSSRRSWIVPALIVVLAVGMMVGLVVWQAARAGRKTKLDEISSIAVLPFVNESDGPDIEYLSDGMTESLISSISQLPGISVKAPSSIFRYKNKDVSLQTIAADLNVEAVVNGHIVQRGDQLTLYLSLVNARTEDVIWSKQYDRKAADIVSLQKEIAHDVSDRLQLRLSGSDEERLAKNYTENPEAYQLYLRGRLFWNRRSPKDLQRSIDYFQQAINLDPNYAFAYAGLANAYPLLASYGNLPPRDVMPKARDAALKAIALDDSLAEGHTALGLILHGYDYDFGGAEREYKKAIQLNPNYATAHQLYGELLTCMGRQDEALAEFRQALEIDPLSMIINRMYGESLFYARRYDEAEAQLKKTIELDPTFWTAHASLAYVYQVEGRFSESVEEFAKTHEAIGDLESADLIRQSYRAGGWKGFLSYMVSDHRPRSLPLYLVSIFFLELGKKDDAIATLNDVYQLRDYLVVWSKVDPRFDALQTDPRFQEIVNKINSTD